MANSIKQVGEGLGLQITGPAREAHLVDEDVDGDTQRRAPVRVYAFDELLLVLDRDRVDQEDVVDLVTAAARDSRSIHRAMDATVQHAGNGYQTPLPPAEDAGFREGDRAPVYPAPGMLVVATDEQQRLARDLVSIRRDQRG